MNLNWSTEISELCDEVITEPPPEPRRTMRFVDSRHYDKTANINGTVGATDTGPRGAACLTKILGAIRSRHCGAQALELYLHVLDDIDFDCQQPFLAEVLGELVSNAAQAMRRQETARIDVMATQYNDRLFLQVADNGPGMPSGMAKWFEHRSGLDSHNNRRKGSGLDTAALLVEIAGGRLELVTSGPEGTRLGFSLPVTDHTHVATRGVSP
ncbi:MAG: ATP-binding protein [Pseudomonadota bacterium]